MNLITNTQLKNLRLIEKLADTISDLEKFGCGQYAKGHYVAISSILYAQTLEFIFYKKRNTRPEKKLWHLN